MPNRAMTSAMRLSSPGIRPGGALGPARLRRLQQRRDGQGQLAARLRLGVRAPREIQNARRIIGRGPGWVERLRAAVNRGEILPAIAAALVAPGLAVSALPTPSSSAAD